MYSAERHTVATMPAYTTQEAKILRLLMGRGPRGVSGREAEDMLRVRDLPKRISVLRHEYGVDVIRVLKSDEMGQRYARYYLSSAFPTVAA